LLRQAGRLAAQARAKLGPGPPQSALPAGLTRREAEIARLAAQGLRDKDIAQALTLSVRTIESHLATTYRKLNIASRRELDGALNGTIPAR
jgi:DNA-binding NarL/FixJ family response regulator